MISMVCMGQGNPRALATTLENTQGIVDEIIFGDLLIFERDRKIIEGYKEYFNLKIIPLPFNYIFENGFSSILNKLAEHATNDMVLYLNISETISEGKESLKSQLSNQYNAYSFDHATEVHRWFRLYNRHELQWSGLIHEQLSGNFRECPFNVFRMADTEKDIDDPFYAKVMNDIKELVYFNQYLKIAQNKELLGATHEGWRNWVLDQYDDMQQRLQRKGKRLEAFEEGNLQMYLDDIFNNTEFESERFQSSDLINYQGDRKLL